MALVVSAASCSSLEAGAPALEAASSSIGTSVPTTTAAQSSTPTTEPPPAVTTGAEALADSDFALLEGRRVGLIANHTSQARGEQLIDLLDAAPNVELMAIFAAEHDIRGIAPAGELFGDTVDPVTGVPIFSLYGETRRPTPEMLADVDVLVYDLQDVGARFYTFISTMGLSMQSAADAGIPFVVLDRPNPGGGEASGGFVLEEDQLSFIGQYPIPGSYGLTAGELARAIKGERWLSGLDGLVLDVVAMVGWERGMRWPATEQPWLPPSPGLPTFETSLAYPGTVLFEATSISYGGGTDETFAIFGAAWADGAALAAELNSRGLPGVSFEAVTFTPGPLPGRTIDPRLNGEELNGVRYVFTDIDTFEPVRSGMHVLEAFHSAALGAEVVDFIDRPVTFDLLAGTTELRRMLVAGRSADEIVDAWAAETAAFDEMKQHYHLYS